MEIITISKEEYDKLKEQTQVDKELLKDIVSGIKDILEEKIKEI